MKVCRQKYKRDIFFFKIKIKNLTSKNKVGGKTSSGLLHQKQLLQTKIAQKRNYEAERDTVIKAHKVNGVIK